ncbi:MAG: biopolymer transporter ExbD [Phycisphaerae bacterium]|nr:biopolymer transporter ExbD [Phycisphaerae bacterium]
MRFARRMAADGGVDMTPMIDIVFQLLIFFLTTAAIAQASRVQLDLPREAGAPDPSPTGPGIVISIRADGSCELAGRTVTMDELTTAARASYAERGRRVPVVRADRNAPGARFNDVIDACRQAGFDGIRLATTPGGGT